MSRLFADQDFPSTSIFSSTPYTYDHNVELQRKIAFGKNVDRQSVVRALASNILWGTLDLSLGEEYKNTSTNLYFPYLRHIVSGLQEEQVRRMNTLYVNGNLTVERADGLLAESGLVRLPRSKQELQERVANTPLAKVAARAAEIKLRQAA